MRRNLRAPAPTTGGELQKKLAGVPATELATCFVPWDEAHFSRRGHALVADALWRRLVADGVVGARPR